MKNPFRIIGLVLAGMVSAAGAVGTAQPAQALPSTFNIINWGSYLCLEPVGSDLGAPIVQMPCDSTRPTQRWGITRATTTHNLLVNQANGRCMDVRDGKKANSTVVQLWSCDLHARSMRWRISITPSLYFVIYTDVDSSKCLDIRAGSLEPGAQLQIYTCSPPETNSAQLFDLR